jgi:hypothetical protein
MPTTMNRLTTSDDLFLKLYKLYGNTLGGQIAWRFDQPLGQDTLRRLHAHLSHGFLARRVRTTLIPAARPWWEQSTESFPLGWDPQTVPENGELDWLDAQGTADLDPTTGRGWRLSAAPTADGGMLMSLVGSHVVADGGAAMYAIVDALQRLESGAAPDFATSSGRLVGLTPTTGLLRAHLHDAFGQVRAAAQGVRAAYAARGVAELARNPRPAEPALSLPDRYTPVSVVVETKLDEWKAVAAAHQGTSNGLLIGVAVGLLGRTGRVADGADA